MIEKYVDAEELKRLLSTLVVFLGALMVAALFAVILVPGLRNANRPAAPMPVNPVVGEPGWLDITEFPAERGKVIPPLDPKILMTPSPELLAKGKGLFEQNCTPCHGERGQGDGPAAVTMIPRPRNFTSADGWVIGHDLPSIYKTESEGIRGTSMAMFDNLSKQDRMALAHYVQSLGRFPHAPGSPQALQDLSRNLAEPGGKTPNRIPVSQAMSRLLEETSAPAAPLAVIETDNSAGAEVLRRVITDPAGAARTLSASSAWRTSAKELAAGILPGVPANGFSRTSAFLSDAEWQALHAALLKQIPARSPK